MLKYVFMKYEQNAIVMGRYYISKIYHLMATLSKSDAWGRLKMKLDLSKPDMNSFLIHTACELCIWYSSKNLLRIPQIILWDPIRCFCPLFLNPKTILILSLNSAESVCWLVLKHCMVCQWFSTFFGYCTTYWSLLCREYPSCVFYQ